MSADFVPFAQTIGNRGGPGPDPVSFTPVTVPANPPPTHSHAAEVRVELKREGDRVSLIRVHCRCGEVIELACDYNI